MHGFGFLGGKKWKQRRHMLPVPTLESTVAAASDSVSSDSFFKDGRKICVGDCALFKPPQDSPPFVGIIRWLKLDKQNNLRLVVNWLYRPADLKLGKGTLLEAAPNEVFYSFHKDEIPAASLLHPCKVSFLRKGVELPSGISSFVCRRVYDIRQKRLWWLTDKDYIEELQEEVDKLLDKTRLEMHGAMQSGGCAPKPLNGPTSAQQVKSGSDSIQNSTSSFSSHVKGKKRERGDQGSDSIKRDRVSKMEDDVLKSELAKITDKGGLVDFEGVRKLVQLMQPDSAEKKIDLAGRKMFVDVIAVTDRLDCLEHFVQIRGLPVLDEWLQEVHKGKIGDDNSPKETDKSVEEFLFALLRALDKLPVNLLALQTCNVGKSVNHLRSHKNSEIHRKARSLVDRWKKRVEAEMNMNDAKSGASRSISWPTKQITSEVSNVASRKAGGSTDVGPKVSILHSSASKTSQVKTGSAEPVPKPSLPPSSTKSSTVSTIANSKDMNFRASLPAETSDLPLTTIKEERSSSSSQSQNNSHSCSSDHAKTVGSSCKSSAGSVSVKKTSSGSSRRRNSSNGLSGSAVQKELGSSKVSTSNRNISSERASPVGISHDQSSDVPLLDQGNSQRLTVRLPNNGRSPGRGANGGYFEDPGRRYSIEKNDNNDTKVRGKSDMLKVSTLSNNKEVRNNNEVSGRDKCDGQPQSNELRSAGDEGNKVLEVSKSTSSPLGIMHSSGKSYEASYSSINALIESCVKFSEASASVSAGDDSGIDLLASVAAGVIGKSENVSPSDSPRRNSPGSEVNDIKLRLPGAEVTQTQCQFGANDAANMEQVKTEDLSEAKDEVRNTASLVPPTASGDQKVASICREEKIGEYSAHLESPLTNFKENSDEPCVNSDVVKEEVLNAKVEVLNEVERCNLLQEQRKSGEHWVKSSSVSDSKLKGGTQLLNENERSLKSSAVLASDLATEDVKLENISNKSPQVRVGEDPNAGDKESIGGILTEQKPSLATENAELHCGASCVVEADSKDDKTGNTDAQGESEAMNLASSNSSQSAERAKNSERKESLLAQRESLASPMIETDPCEKPNDQKLNRVNAELRDEQHIDSGNVTHTVPGSDAGKLDFDLNEGFSVDDGGQGELVNLPVASALSSVDLPSIPLSVSSGSGSVPASITVTAAAKGPFVPPENLLRSKGELGWKGSAATSAFRPAEPRKPLETTLNTSDSHVVDSPACKSTRPPLDFDLNVPDERVLEDFASRSSAMATCSDSGLLDRGLGGLDFDLNRVDESPEVEPFSVSNSSGIQIPLPTRSSFADRMSNGGVHISRGFDLNNGPGPDEIGSDAVPRSQHAKNSLPFQVPAPGIRMNNADFGSYSSWFPPGNPYSAITVSSVLPGRGEQSYVAASGSHRILASSGNTSFGHDLYRGQVLSSTPAVAFPASTPFQHPGFPFESSFSVSSNSFPGSSAYIDSASGGAVCFPTIPSQLVVPNSVISSPFPRSFVMGLPGGTSSVPSESRKWGNQGLDLNAGPGAEMEPRDEKLPSASRQVSHPGPQALAEEQLKMFQMAGNAVKRKEPDGGWDAVDRLSYKQPWH